MKAFWSSLPSLAKRFLLALALAGICVLAVRYAQGRLFQSDLKVYYGAARDFWGWPLDFETFDRGSRLTGKVYDKPYGLGSGFFKYAPAVLFLFTPLAALPWSAAQAAYALLSVAAMLGVLVQGLLLARETKLLSSEKNVASVLVIATVAGLVHFYRELQIGNVNLILINLLLFGLRQWLRHKTLSSSVAVALAIFIKPHFVVLLPLLLLGRQLRWLLAICTLGCFLLALPLIVLGPTRGLELTTAWISAMGSHNSPSAIFDHANMFQSWLMKLLHLVLNIPLDESYTLSLTLLAGMMMLWLVALIRAGHAKFQSQAMALQFALVMATVPSLVLTDTQHFLFSMPLVVLLLSTFEKLAKHLQYAFLLCLVFYGLNMGDLVGAAVSSALVRTGALGWANMGLLAIGFVKLRHLKS